MYDGVYKFVADIGNTLGSRIDLPCKNNQLQGQEWLIKF